MIRIAFVMAFALALAACATQKTAPLPSAPPAGEPAGYAGIDSGQLRVAMGNPAFMRKEGQGIEMWRYDGQGCKAFFFLYPQGAGLSVQHVETIPRPSDAAADVACLNRLRVDGKATS
ncbi:MAG TPA: hypothetical protein VGH02_15655 [Rhizomicrobium sp.]|jgi:hypothetical protein